MAKKVLTDETIIMLDKDIPKSQYREYFEKALNIEKINGWYAFIGTQQGITIKEALVNYKKRFPDYEIIKIPKRKNVEETIAEKQRRTKPKLEDIIVSRASMDDEAKQVAFAFLDYCNAKNITYKWSSTNRWNLNEKGKSIGYIGIGVRKHDDNSWNIIIRLNELLQYEDFIQKEGLTEIICNNIHYCERCNKVVCSKSATIFGKKYHNLCGIGVCFKNPDAKTLDSVKKILDTWMHCVTESKPYLSMNL